MRPPAEGLRLAPAVALPGDSSSAPLRSGAEGRGRERADVKLRHRGSPLKTRGQAWGARTESIPVLVQPTEARCV